MKLPSWFPKNKFGLHFAGIALVVETVVYILFAVRSEWVMGNAALPLFYTGFGIPLISGVIGQGLAGCNAKDGGCGLGLLSGFLVGFALLPLLYYCLGAFLSMLWKWIKSKRN